MSNFEDYIPSYRPCQAYIDTTTIPDDSTYASVGKPPMDGDVARTVPSGQSPKHYVRIGGNWVLITPRTDFANPLYVADTYAQLRALINVPIPSLGYTVENGYFYGKSITGWRILHPFTNAYTPTGIGARIGDIWYKPNMDNETLSIFNTGSSNFWGFVGANKILAVNLPHDGDFSYIFSNPGNIQSFYLTYPQKLQVKNNLHSIDIRVQARKTTNSLDNYLSVGILINGVYDEKIIRVGSSASDLLYRDYVIPFNNPSVDSWVPHYIPSMQVVLRNGSNQVIRCTTIQVDLYYSDPLNNCGYIHNGANFIPFTHWDEI